MRTWYFYERYFDGELSWSAGYDLRRLMFGISFYKGGFYLHVGPFWLSHSEMPF